MKRILILSALIGIGLFQSCKKNKSDEPNKYVCSSCVSAPEAKSENDNKSSGVYKAVVTGSSGTIAFYIQNGNNEVKAIINFDGKTAVLTTTYFNTWQAGSAISNAQFSGVLDGKNITASLSVNADGTNPSLTMNIPGHTISVVIFKETSQSLVRGFEGSYEGDEKGVLNILMMGEEYTVIVDGNALTRRQQLKNGKVEFTSSGTTVNGAFLSESELKGTWSNTDKEKGTWQAKRTL